MVATFQVVALSALDPDGTDRRDEPKLLYPDAIKAAEALKDQGKAFRVHPQGEASREELDAFRALGALG